MTGIVRNIYNDTLYRHVEGNKFKNTITLVIGEVSEDKAKEVFRINTEATMLCNEFPIIEEMITRLGLKIEK